LTTIRPPLNVVITGMGKNKTCFADRTALCWVQTCLDTRRTAGFLPGHGCSTL